MNTLTSIYEDIAARTAGDIYLGVVGPARTGKSTFIKRFMETLVLPSIDDDYRRQRARDELPQSGSGRTVMTAEPKFVPEEAVEIAMEGGGTFSVRLVDCVGYLVPGAVGQLEDGEPRMVHTPWFPQEIPMAEAAEIGTRKVIAEHATIGIVITTDGTITDLPREAYPEAEGRVIEELKALGKPFLILLNSAHPQGEAAQKLRAKLAEQYDVTCLAVSCLDLDQQAVTEIIQAVLYEFPLEELQLFLPDWVETLPTEHPIRTALFQAIRAQAGKLVRIRDVKPAVAAMGQCELVTGASVTGMKLGSGCCQARLELPRSLFYDTLSQQTGFALHSDGELLALLERLAVVQAEHQKVAAAMEEVRATGYGIVIPEAEELELEQPEIIKQGGRYGVRLRAKAPSIHMIRADIQAEVSPIVGSEKQSEDMLGFLLEEFEGAPEKIWQSNIFGRSFHELINEDLATKLKHMPEDAREKMRLTLERILNEGSGGLICIIL
ncbi:MAG: stage IV sporulation protein A [Clostridiales bacterium]|jgi:stage IV sporulation protein A|nr:stage IV sporulation protein A [Clostridiales bacterium]MBS4880100.1 stage IV sporulation protein A [Bacillota bacterium]MDD7085851.1 stage IV sporulation protein A [Clostridiales bacterium]